MLMERIVEPTPRLIELERRCAKCELALVEAMKLDNAKLLLVASESLVRAHGRFRRQARLDGYRLERAAPGRVPSAESRERVIGMHRAWSRDYARCDDRRRVRARLRSALSSELVAMARGYVKSAQRARVHLDHMPAQRVLALGTAEEALQSAEEVLLRAAEDYARRELSRSVVTAYQQAAKGYIAALKQFTAATERETGQSSSVPNVARPNHVARAQHEGQHVLRAWLERTRDIPPERRRRMRSDQLHREVSKHALTLVLVSAFAQKRLRARELEQQLALRRLEGEHAILCTSLRTAERALDGSPERQREYEVLVQLEAEHVRAMAPLVEQLQLAPPLAATREEVLERRAIDLALAWSRVPIAQRCLVSSGVDARSTLAARYYRSIAVRGAGALAHAH